MLGQWTYHTTQINWLEGEIMEPAYCPITATGYGSGTYAGDGYDCVHILGPVSAYASGYWDQASAIAGAMTDGTVVETGQLPAVIWRADRRVYYSPGNTGGDFSTGDTAQLVANMCICEGVPVGACCDPYTGDCTDDVLATDCIPLQFFYEQSCADLDPPCGNLGACCDDDTGECTQEFELNCDGRFVSGAACDPDPFVPACGEYHACPHEIVMWDDFGDGWNGGFIDVYVDGDLVLAGVTLASGAGPESVFFEAGTGSVIQTVWTDGGWAYECSYFIYDQYGTELCSDGVGGAYPIGVTCTGNCEAPAGGCCLGFDGCELMTGDDCATAGGFYLGDFTDCGSPADCDADGQTDLCAIATGFAEDCNGNDIPDSCDIANCGMAPPVAVITIEVMTDDYGNETTWELVEQGGGTVAAGGPYDAYNPTLYTYDVEVSPTSCYDFTIYDAWGNGICCSYGTGYYNVYYEGDLVGSGGDFDLSETVSNIGGGCGAREACQHSITMWDSYGNGWNDCFIDVYVNSTLVLAGATIGSGDEETVFFDADTGDEIFVDFTPVSWATETSYCVYDGEATELGCANGGYDPGDGDLTVTGNCGAEEEPQCDPDAWCQDCQPDGIPDGCQLTTPPLIGSRDCCTSPDAVITIEILTDTWGYETSWTLTEQGGCGVIASGSGLDSGTFYTFDIDVCSTSCYDFTINDDYGDGIYDPGGFTIYYEGDVVADFMGGLFTGATITIPNIGGGCEVSPTLISQLPNQSNGIFSDCDCDYCSGGAQVLADNFVLSADAAISMIRFWGGMYPSDHPAGTEFGIVFYEDSGGYPGAEVANYTMTGEAEQTGIVLFGVHEWVVSITLDTPLSLGAGTYFVEIRNDTNGDSDSWFWEVGNLDFAAGIMGQAFAFECPPASWNYDSATDMAFELYAVTGPPANDCDENCVPDECDPDCNCDGVVDACEEPPFVPTEPEIYCPAELWLECPASTDPADTGMAYGIDNCGNPAVITYSDEVTLGCGDTKTVVRTWTATDECAGLSSQCVQTITVQDTTPPEITCPDDLTVVCPESTDPADTGTATGTDACGDVVITYSDVVTPAEDADTAMYTISRTWMATDECGLESECVQTITVLKVAASLIIKQGACPAPFNCNGHGILPMVLTGDVDFDVYDVDQSTVRLVRVDGFGGEVAPSPGAPPGFKFKDLNHPYVGPGPCSCNESEDSDGIMDLSMKFRTDDVCDALMLNCLRLELPGGTIVELALVGELSNGCEFIAFDCVLLVPPGSGGDTRVLFVDSNVTDVFIEVQPMDITLDSDGYTDFERTYMVGRRSNMNRLAQRTLGQHRTAMLGLLGNPHGA